MFLIVLFCIADEGQEMVRAAVFLRSASYMSLVSEISCNRRQRVVKNKGGGCRPYSYCYSLLDDSVVVAGDADGGDVIERNEVEVDDAAGLTLRQIGLDDIAVDGVAVVIDIVAFAATELAAKVDAGVRNNALDRTVFCISENVVFMRRERGDATVDDKRLLIGTRALSAFLAIRAGLDRLVVIKVDHDAGSRNLATTVGEGVSLEELALIRDHVVVGFDAGEHATAHCEQQVAELFDRNADDVDRGAGDGRGVDGSRGGGHGWCSVAVLPRLL